jgi:ribosome-associated toxin RatA of RatAB toxin-antitoxin module
LHINFRGLKKEFTTENFGRPGERIDMSLMSGPFRRLAGSWVFTALTDTACKVDLNLRYQFASTLLEKVAGPAFQDIMDTFVDAFVRRADEKFGGT